MEKDLHIPMAFKERTCMHYENDISEYNVNPRIPFRRKNENIITFERKSYNFQIFYITSLHTVYMIT